MSRPASWTGKSEELESYSSGRKGRKPSLSHRTSLSGSTIEVHLPQRYLSTFAPLETIAGSPALPSSPSPAQFFPSSPMLKANISKSERKQYVGVPIGVDDRDLSVGSRAPIVSKYRTRRVLERVVMCGLAAGLLWSLVFRGSEFSFGKNGQIQFRKGAKPLKSSEPLQSFRANLHENRGYVTTFPYGGFTNQLIELFKLVHLAHRLNRVAILPELHAVHSEGFDMPLSRVFDLRSFAHFTNVTTTEWKDVKLADTPGTDAERLSCWGWRDPRPLARYNIHTDFWPPPGQLTVPSSIETSMTFPAIEVLVSQPQTDWLTAKSIEYFGSVEKAPPFPDSQLLCFENLFYVPSLRFVEGSVDRTFSIEELSPQDPVWDKVGKHLRFSDAANAIADEFLEGLLGSARRRYVSVHIRQGDFVSLGRVSKSSSIIHAYLEAEEEVQEELLARTKGSLMAIASTKLPVVFATDSDDVKFIARIEELGWIYLDHKEFDTANRFGGWYPGLLDSLILSRSMGMVGTRMSTFSYIAARRVESWNGGVTRIVGV